MSPRPSASLGELLKLTGDPDPSVPLLPPVPSLQLPVVPISDLVNP